MKIKNVIVGCGITGAVVAQQLATVFNEEVLIIDKREHIGGNCFDYKKDNITIHKYGPHIFHTDNERVWHYLNQFTNWKLYMHEVMAVIEGRKVNIPYNINSIYSTFPISLAEEMISELIQEYGYSKRIPILELAKNKSGKLNLLADYVYENVFLNYTAKQWGRLPSEIDRTVTARVPVNISKDNRYFQDKYQGIPQRGYTDMIANILNNVNIKIMLNTNFDNIKDKIECERLFYTGPIDEYYNFKFGTLPYRSVDFDLERIDLDYFQEKAVVNYPNNYDFTRITEFKHFLSEDSPVSYIMKEFPCDYIYKENEPYYVISNEENKKLYQKYLRQALNENNIWFLGRLGDYKYYDMDDAVERALSVIDQIKADETGFKRPSQDF